MIEKERKNLLIYNDKGSGNSVRQVMEMLTQIAHHDYNITFVEAKDIIGTDQWEQYTELVVMPGGRARPYYTALGTKWKNESVSHGEKRVIKETGSGNERIRKFVENGGCYLGICAGAYYGAALTVFEKGGELEVIDEGPLNFFPGTAEGPACGLGKFKYNTESGAEIVKLSIANFLSRDNLSVYYNGGCFFTEEKGLVLARYSNNAVAIVENQVGKGRAILSGVHFEWLLSNSLDSTQQIIKKQLSKEDHDRQYFQAEILNRLNIALSPYWRQAISSSQSQHQRFFENLAESAKTGSCGDEEKFRMLTL